MRKDGKFGLKLIVLLVALAAAAALYWRLQTIGQSGPAPSAQPVPVIAATVEVKDAPVWLDAIGTVEADAMITIQSRVSGELTALGFVDGGDVEQGAMIAKIDSRALRADYDQAAAESDQYKAQLEIARIDLRRYQALGNRVTGQTLDTQRVKVKELEATVKRAEAAVRNAEIQLSYAEIKAPISGRAGIRRVDVGNIVQANDATGIVDIVSLSPIMVLFSLPQQNLPAILRAAAESGGPEVLALTADGGAVIEKGRLAAVDNQIDQTTGVVRLKAVFDNRERQLWPGAFVTVRLLVDTRKQARIIPAAAILRGPQGAFVYVIDADQNVSMVSVKTALIEDGEAVLDEGPPPGALVVLDGMARLSPGAKARIVSRPGADGAP